MLPVSTELVTVWGLTLTNWTDARRHDTVLGIAAKHGELAWLATRYRQAAARNPEDAIAPARLARVQRAATIVMLAKPPPTSEPMPKLFKMAALLLVGSAVAVGLGLFIGNAKIQQRHDTMSMTGHR